jgi:nucleoid-associated protein YgaU
MGLVAFVREAGAFLFGHSAGNPAPVSAAGQVTVDVLQKQAAAVGIPVDNLAIDLNQGTATVRGSVRSQADREKLILAVGNTPGVAQVDDLLAVAPPIAAQGAGQSAVNTAEPPATLYTVKKGDTLSAIAKTYYKDAGKYPRIFEANRPMLGDPNKIYPGQVLRIPPQA